MDAIKLEVIYNATNQIAYELTQKLMRNGYSSIVKESQDLALSICDSRGTQRRTVFSQPGGPWRGRVSAPGYCCGISPAPSTKGDTFILNHPYRYCQNHPSDVTLISPVFYAGGDSWPSSATPRTSPTSAARCRAPTPATLPRYSRRGF